MVPTNNETEVITKETTRCMGPRYIHVPHPRSPFMHDRTTFTTVPKIRGTEPARVPHCRYTRMRRYDCPRTHVYWTMQ